MPSGRNKGMSWEREICKELSLWWSVGKRDDVFYRTGGSGGRATTRGRKGKETINHCGDVQASDPDGMPLMKLFALELKRGYNSNTIQDIIDTPPPRTGKLPTTPVYLQWIDQAKESMKHAGSVGWMILARRDKRSTIIIMSQTGWRALLEGSDKMGSDFGKRCYIYFDTDDDCLVMFPLQRLLVNFTADNIRNAIKASGK